MGSSAVAGLPDARISTMSFGDPSDRELEYHETLYSGFAQEHFAKPAVRAFRQHLAARILRITRASHTSRVLSLGCGIGDTELLLAPSVGQVTGIDLSLTAIRQAQTDAERAGISNAAFVAGDPAQCQLAQGSFDVVMAVFFLHHLQEAPMDRVMGLVRSWLVPGGMFYSLDPSRYRLSGALGKVFVPNLMKKYRSPDERELAPSRVLEQIAAHGFTGRIGIYDFLSTPLAGLFPGARGVYRLARVTDELLTRTPLLKRVGSNFEVIARVRSGVHAGPITSRSAAE
jgi:SAM-dependent methyltransferase